MLIAFTSGKKIKYSELGKEKSVFRTKDSADKDKSPKGRRRLIKKAASSFDA